MCAITDPWRRRDTAGQERFASLAPMYYRNAQAAVVVYDITKPTSLAKAKHWVEELHRQASPGIVIALVGNKVDLAEPAEDGHRAVSAAEGRAYADDEHLLFFESSAKTGENVDAVFEAIANAIPESSLKPRAAAVAGAPRTAANGAQAVDVGGAHRGAEGGCAC